MLKAFYLMNSLFNFGFLGPRSCCTAKIKNEFNLEALMSKRMWGGVKGVFTPLKLFKVLKITLFNPFKSLILPTSKKSLDVLKDLKTVCMYVFMKYCLSSVALNSLCFKE